MSSLYNYNRNYIINFLKIYIKVDYKILFFIIRVIKIEF